MSSEEAPSFPPPRKYARRLSGYNLFHKEFLQSEDGKALTTLAEKNKISAERWKEADGAVKAEYNETAKNIQPKVTEKKKKQQLGRILAQLSDVSAHLKDMGCEMMYTIVQGSDHFCGGTDKGCEFLEKDAPWIPYSFIGAVHPKPSIQSCSQSIPEAASSDRKEVQKVFNHLYALHAKKPGAKLPYSRISELGISLEGIDVQLKHPSSYGVRTLRDILSRKDSLALKVEKTSSTCSTESQAQSPQSKEQSSSDSTRKVVLLTEHQQPVGMGVLSDTSAINIDDVDTGNVRVLIEYVQPETKGLDGEYLEAGQFTS